MGQYTTHPRYFNWVEMPCSNSKFDRLSPPALAANAGLLTFEHLYFPLSFVSYMRYKGFKRFYRPWTVP